MLKDNLKAPIKVGKYEFDSINEVLKEDYARYKVYSEGYGLATYRNKILCLDIESEKMFNSMELDFSEDEYKGLDSLYSNIYMQIDQINDMCDLEEK